MEPSPLSIEAGFRAEQDACSFLEKNGMTFVAKNYRIEKMGEIDLIMQDQDHLVFVEVKLRNDGDFGLAAEMVDKPKQSRIIRTAKYYLQETGQTEKVFCRFDVVAIMPANQEQILWIKDAFQVQY